MKFYEIVTSHRIHSDVKYGVINNKNNPRFNINNILKHDIENDDLFYYVLKDSDLGYLAIIGILKNPIKSNIYNFTIANFESMYTGKEYGKKLLISTLELFKNIWLMADPSQTESLVEYYRNISTLQEFVVENSIYNKPLHFFYCINFDRRLLKDLFLYIEKMFSKPEN